VILTVVSIAKFFLGRGDELNLKGLSSDLRKQVKKLRQDGDLVGAAELLFESEQYEAAAALFTEVKMPARAAESQELAGNAAQAIALYKTTGNRVQAGELYAKMGQYEAAALEMVQAGAEKRSAEFFALAGQHRRAAEIFEELGDLQRAAKSYQDAGDLAQQMAMFCRIFEDEYQVAMGELKVIESGRALAKQAATYYLSEGEEFDRGVELLAKAGFNMEAAKAYEDAGQFSKAAEIYEQARMYDEAAQMYEDMNMPQRAATCHAEAAMVEGDLEQAAGLLASAGEYSRAAELFMDLRQPGKAASIFLRAKQFDKAAALFEKIGDFAKAGKAFEASKDYARAADLFAKISDTAGELRASAGMEDFYRVGRILVSLGRLDEAIEALSRVDPADPRHREALELRGDILWKKKSHEAAYNAYMAAYGDANPNASNIQLLYKAGRCKQSDADQEAALNILEKVVVVDANFRDIQQRLSKAKSDVQFKQVGSAILKRPTSRVSSPRMAAVAVARPKSEEIPAASNQLVSTLTQSERRYEILEEIARGGMGVVYRARDVLLSRIVAFKILSQQLRDNAHAREYFMREARAAAKLNHTNIVQIYDVGIQDGEYYIAMEFIDGRTLKQYVTRQGPFPEKLVRYVLTHSCKGLQYAHDRGVVHRDIKSGNIMLANENKALKIMDFGLAKVVSETQQDHTRAIGTPFYMSPEQILGNELDQRSDIYSLGVMLFEMSTGTVPFFKGDLAYHHVHTAPPSPRSLNPSVSEEMERIIFKALQKKPADRFASCNEIVEFMKGNNG